MTSHRVQTLSKNDWARGGLFQQPRLRINDKLDPNPGGLSSTEQFFNVCFCTAFGVAKVDKYLVADQSLIDFLAYFFAWWYAWILGSEYASRYNNVDFTHNLFWMIYGGGVALMLEHTGGGLNGLNAPWFCYSCAFISSFVGLFTLRVGFYVPEAKVSTVWHGSFMLIISVLWVLAGTISAHRQLWWFLALITEAISSSIFLLKFTDHIVPISKPYAINKFSIICVLALGAFVAAAVGSVNPEAWAVESRLAVRGSSMLAFSIFINLKFLVVDVDQISLEWHALSRPIQYRVFWRLFQPILILTIVAASAGLDSLLTEIAPAIDSDSSRVVFGRRTAFFSTAVFFLALVFQRTFLHLTPIHVGDDPRLIADRYFSNCAQCLMAMVLVAYPELAPLSTWPLNLGDIIVIAVAASALVILHLVIKQRELEFLDKQEPSRQSSGDGEEQPLKASETLEEAGVSWQASTNITQFGTGSTL